MKVFFLITVFFVLLISNSCAKNPPDLPEDTLISNEKVPLNDLRDKYYRGLQGGLYPNGSNSRPDRHNNAGIQIASEIRPLDENGNTSMQDGSIVWLSVGMSNTTQEASAFIQAAKTYQDIHPRLVLVDGAQGNWDIDMMNDPNASYWQNISKRLNAAGLNEKQVQIIWFKQADRNFPDTSFMGYTQNFKNKLKASVQLLKSKYPNLKMCYLSSRIYAGYQTGTGSNPEPYAYLTGWGVKFFIEDQINGNVELAYSGKSPLVPWLSWGPYLWANGANPRSDGLKWIFPDDFQPDGIHPSTLGRKKVANQLLEFFTTDETSRIWFLK